MLTMLTVSMLTLSFNIQPVKASGTIYIRADGSVDPPTAPLQRDGDIYTFIDNVYDSIVVERNNTIIDGDGYTLQGVGAYDSSGISLGRVSNNVTVKNMEIKAFFNSIKIYESMNNSIYANNIVDNVFGISLFSWDIYSSYNHIFTNNIRNNFCGISVGLGSIALNNSIYENNITNNDCGIHITNGFNNTIYGNNIRNNSVYGIRLESSNNYIYHNNFIDNTEQVHWQSAGNIWDDGYPSGGNYWSDYSGVDSNSDGIGDTPYTIDASNQDRYPLMNPWIERKVGVKVGDWAKYGNFVFTWSSNDPKQYPPSDLTEWMNVTVQTILSTNITFQLTIHYQTSTEETIIGWIDVSTSEAGGWWMQLFISADLSAGDTIYQTMFWAPINETIFREYVGVTRETNHFSFEWSFSYMDSDKYSNGSYSAYWDRATGILTQFMIENVHVDETLNYVTSTSISFQIIDTNIWEAPIPTTTDELKTEIEELGSEGEIDNQGIVKSLMAKLNVAQKLVDKGKTDEAVNVLEDFIMQVQELSGIHITVEAADILIKSAEYILSHP